MRKDAVFVPERRACVQATAFPGEQRQSRNSLIRLRYAPKRWLWSKAGNGAAVSFFPSLSQKI